MTHIRRPIFAVAALAVLAGCSTGEAANQESEQPTQQTTVATQDSALEETEETIPEELAFADEETSEEPSPTEPEASEDGPHAIGEVVTIDDWDVTISSVTRDDRVEAYELEGPTQGYIVTLDGTYNGEDESSLDWLTVHYVANDNRVYASFDAHLSYEYDEQQDPQPVVAGGTAIWKASIAVPEGTATNSIIKIEGALFDSAEFEVGPLP